MKQFPQVTMFDVYIHSKTKGAVAFPQHPH